MPGIGAAGASPPYSCYIEESAECVGDTLTRSVPGTVGRCRIRRAAVTVWAQTGHRMGTDADRVGLQGVGSFQDRPAEKQKSP